jgi:hypothetical protein
MAIPSIQNLWSEIIKLNGYEGKYLERAPDNNNMVGRPIDSFGAVINDAPRYRTLMKHNAARDIIAGCP